MTLTQRAFRNVPLTLLSLALLVGGCANPYIRNYQPASSGTRGILSEKTELTDLVGEPRLVSTTDPKADALKMRENGYVLLGRSKFKASPVNEKMALEQARKVGADVVMVSKKYVGTQSETLPMSVWNPGQRVEQTERVVIQEGNQAPKFIDRVVTTTTEGEYHTTYVEQNVEYFDYSASYWAKAKPPVFGVNVRALDDASRTRLGTNKGVQVRVVIKNSPAYDADILRGDILMSFNKVEVRDPDHFFALVDRARGKTVPVLLDRDGQQLKKDVTLRSR